MKKLKKIQVNKFLLETYKQKKKNRIECKQERILQVNLIQILALLIINIDLMKMCFIFSVFLKKFFFN